MHLNPIALANELHDSASFERAVLEGLARSVGFDVAFMAMKAEAPSTVNVDAAKLNAVIARSAYADELGHLKAVALSRKGVVVDTELLGEHAVRKLGYHRDFAAPVGGRHTLVAVLSVRGTALGGLVLGRSGSTFSGEQIAFVESILPSLSIARASFRLPWSGGPLPVAPDRRRLHTWIHGQNELERLRGSEDRPELVVRDRAGFREMVAVDDHGELRWSRARIDAPEQSGWFYINLLHLAATRAANRDRILFIGCGGGVGVRQFAHVYPGAKLDVVESDERVVALARRWFGLEDVPNLSITIGDGVSFLERAPAETWDAVVVDAYDGSELAPHFSSRRFFENVRRTLRRGGGVAVNVIDSLEGTGELRRMERIARAHLQEVRLVPVLDPDETYSPTAIRNVVLVAHR